jgi:transposase
VPEATGRPAYHPATMLKIYVYGYINQIQSSRRLERDGRNGGVALGLSTEPRP